MWLRVLELFGVGLFVAPIMTAIIWGQWVINRFGLIKPYGNELKAAAKVAFSAQNLASVTYGSIAAGLLATTILLYAVFLFMNPHRKRRGHIRGVDLAPPSVLRRMANDNTLRNKLRRLKERQEFSHAKVVPADVLREHIKQVTIAGIPLPTALEALHLLIGGTTGSGKSLAIKEVLAGAVARGDRMVVCDPNGEYFSLFGQKGDIVLNPFDKRFPGWSIFNEIRETYDAERYARSVIPDGRGANDQEWHGYAQFLFQETVLKLREDGHKSTDVLVDYLCSLPIEQLGAYLEHTAAIGLFDQGANKALSSTRFILTRYMSPHKHLRDGDFSLRRWLEEDSGNLYITWRQDMADALRPLISTWFDVLITSTLSLPIHGRPRPLWFVCDELASLERLSSLEDGLTKGRKHGGRFLCGIQSTAQLDDIYGKDKAITLRSCFRNAFYLNIPSTDPQTAEEFSKGIGEREYIRDDISRTRTRDGLNRQVSRRVVKERAVLPSQIHELPDLTGYLCLAGEYPISRVRLQRRPYQVHQVPFME